MEQERSLGPGLYPDGKGELEGVEGGYLAGSKRMGRYKDHSIPA